MVRPKQDSDLPGDGPSSGGVPARHDTARPRSGTVAGAVSGYVGRLLAIAASAEEGGELRGTLARMLAVLSEIEPAARAGLRLRGSSGDEDLLLLQGAAPAQLGEQGGDGRLFPELGEELVAPLAGCAEGSLHLAAPAFLRASAESVEQMLHDAAAVVALTVRAARVEASRADDRARLLHLEKLASFGRTAAGIVHELNNPLTAIVAYSDFLLKRMEDRGAQDSDTDRLRRISEAATRIQQFCREIVDYSRPGGLHGPVDVHAVIDRALGFCMHSLRSTDIAVARTYRDVPMVMGVDTQLTQVFVNLFTNAWHAMADGGGTLSIATRAAAAAVVVEVGDDGPGIDEAILPHIFESYFTTKPRGQGVGLGLSIVKQIVSDHGGSIRAERRDPRGTLFYVELPVGM